MMVHFHLLEVRTIKLYSILSMEDKSQCNLILILIASSENKNLLSKINSNFIIYLFIHLNELINIINLLF